MTSLGLPRSGEEVARRSRPRGTILRPEGPLRVENVNRVQKNRKKPPRRVIFVFAVSVCDFFSKKNVLLCSVGLPASVGFIVHIPKIIFFNSSCRPAAFWGYLGGSPMWRFFCTHADSKKKLHNLQHTPSGGGRGASRDAKYSDPDSVTRALATDRDLRGTGENDSPDVCVGGGGGVQVHFPEPRRTLKKDPVTEALAHPTGGTSGPPGPDLGGGETALPPPPTHGQQSVSGTADPGVVKQDNSSGGSVDTTKTRSDPQRVRMSGRGEQTTSGDVIHCWPHQPVHPAVPIGPLPRP